MERKKLAVILLLLGRYEVQVRQLDKALKELAKLPENVQKIVVADSEAWSAAPQIQMLDKLNRKTEVCFCSGAKLPAAAMNLGLRRVDADYVLFSLLDDPVAERAGLFLDAIESAKKEQEKERVKERAFYIQPDVSNTGEMTSTINTYGTYGWCQISEVGIELGALCVPMKILNEIGFIDENPLLCDEIERWYSLAVSRRTELEPIAEEKKRHLRIYEYPLRKSGTISHDLAVRYAIYTNGVAAAQRSFAQWGQDFYNDLNDTDRAEYNRITGFVPADATVPSISQRYKILIVGGYWEYHHNQICFFNYLERLYGQGFATYRPVLENTLTTATVVGYDLVIFTRCRTEKALDAIKKCAELGIPTLYMLDDNWLTIAEDHPEYGKVFAPDSEVFNNFIESIGLCDAVWLFSDLLKKDVLPYTKCVQKFCISVDTKTFCVDNPRERIDDEFIVGFSGSLRWDDSAFRALARYARRHKKIQVLLIGSLSKSQEMLFKGMKTIRIPFESYAQYANTMAEIQPDLLLAPIPHTHTAQSKCYNKYIESGVVGAACIYSHCLPYTEVIRDGENGFFVEDETEDGWYTVLERVLSDPGMLRTVQQNAYRDVWENHSVDKMLNAFRDKLTAVIEGDIADD